jgi:Spy/CpxP family protein refolding chaperone
MLKLTDEQKAEIKTIHLAKQKEIQPLKDEVMINKAKINALINKDNPDMREVVSLVEANGKLLTDIQIKNIESKVRIRALLDDEQKVIFDAHDGRRNDRKTMAPPYRHNHKHFKNRL